MWEAEKTFSRDNFHSLGRQLIENAGVKQNFFFFGAAGQPKSTPRGQRQPNWGPNVGKCHKHPLSNSP